MEAHLSRMSNDNDVTSISQKMLSEGHKILAVYFEHNVNEV